MCLVVVAFGVHERFPFVFAGNRDEFHARPAQAAHWWPDRPDLLAGRDLQAGGTWLALHRAGRFATVTNYRDAKPESGKLMSRGHLVTDYVEGEAAPLEFLQGVDCDAYAGFNLLVSDGRALAYLSNRGEPARQLDAGVYGLSNASLDTPWHKVKRGKASMRDLLQRDRIDRTELLRLLDDRDRGPVDEAESGRLPFDKAHAITAPFIVTPDYGTRCSTAVIADTAGRWDFFERRFDPAGETRGETRQVFQAES